MNDNNMNNLPPQGPVNNMPQGYNPNMQQGYNPGMEQVNNVPPQGYNPGMEQMNNMPPQGYNPNMGYNQGMQGYNPNMYGPKKSKTGLIVAIAIVVVVVIGLILFFVLGSGSSDSNSSNSSSGNNNTSTNTDNNSGNSVVDLKKNVSVTAEEIRRGTSDLGVFKGEILFTAKNNNNKDLSVSGTVTLYDKDNKVIEREYPFTFTFQVLSKGQEAIFKLTIPSDYVYERYEFDYEVSDKYLPYNDYKNIEFTSEYNPEYSGSIDVTCKNTLDKDISYGKATVAFYKDGKIVGTNDMSFSSLAAGAEKTLRVGIPGDLNYKKIDYDDYKVYIEASTPEWDRK